MTRNLNTKYLYNLNRVHTEISRLDTLRVPPPNLCLSLSVSNLVDWTCATDKERLIFLDLPSSLSLSKKKKGKIKTFFEYHRKRRNETAVSSVGLW